MFAHLGRRMRLRARSTTSCTRARWSRSSTTAGAAVVFASPKIAADLAPVTVGAHRGHRQPTRTSAAGSRRAAAVRADTDPPTLAWLFYTSGTTGRSKGAMLSHRNLMAMTVAHLADFDSPDENCSLVHGAPMSHGSGLYIAAVRAARRPAGDPGLGRLRARRSSSTCASTIRAAAPSSPRPWCSAWCRPDAACPRNLRTVVYGGGPMYVDSLKKAMAAFGPIFTQLYGQGEAPMTITGLRRADHLRRRRRGPGLGRLRRAPASMSRCCAATAPARTSARSARSSAAVTSSCPATGTTPRPPRRRCRTAGCTPATWARSTSAAS